MSNPKLPFKGHLTRKDNKPWTIRELKAILDSIPECPALDKPIRMSCDEEGNDTSLKLYGIEIAKSGEILLWPAGGC